MFGKKKKGSEPADGNPWGAAPAPSDSPPPPAGGDAFWGAGSAPLDHPGQVPSSAAPPAESYNGPPGAGVPSNVPEMVEPLFLLVCQLHRQVREGRDPEFSRVHREVEETINDIRDRCRKSPAMQQQFEKLLPSFQWYVDYLFGSSDLFPSLKRDWNKNRLGEDADDDDGGILTGDEAVFHELDKTLEIDAGDKLANDRLTFFYNALSTGFRGQYSKSSPDNDGVLRDYMGRMYPRIREYIDSNPGGRVTPEVYDHTDRRDFVAPARDRPLMVICGILCLGMSLLLGYFWLYGNQKQKLESFLNDLRNTTEQAE